MTETVPTSGQTPLGAPPRGGEEANRPLADSKQPLAESCQPTADNTANSMSGQLGTENLTGRTTPSNNRPTTAQDAEPPAASPKFDRPARRPETLRNTPCGCHEGVSATTCPARSIYRAGARAGGTRGPVPYHSVPSCAILTHVITRQHATRILTPSHLVSTGWKGTMLGASMGHRGAAPIVWPMTYSALAYVN